MSRWRTCPPEAPIGPPPPRVVSWGGSPDGTEEVDVRTRWLGWRRRTTRRPAHTTRTRRTAQARHTARARHRAATRDESAPGTRMIRWVTGPGTTPRPSPPPCGIARPDPPPWRRNRRMTGALRPAAAVAATGLASRFAREMRRGPRQLQADPRPCNQSPLSADRRPPLKAPPSDHRHTLLDPSYDDCRANPSRRSTRKLVSEHDTRLEETRRTAYVYTRAPTTTVTASKAPRTARPPPSP